MGAFQCLNALISVLYTPVHNAQSCYLHNCPQLPSLVGRGIPDD